jgi:L-arabinose isomerase
MADGYGFGAEGDWKTAFLLRALKVACAGLPGGASFMEDYTYHFGPGRPLILGSHMLEVCPSIADGRPSVEIHPLQIGNRADPVRLRFTAKAGRGVVVGMSDLGNRFRLIGNVIEVVEPPEPLPHLPVAAATWAPEPSLELAAEAWLTAGGPHHTVMSIALGPDTLEMLAGLTGTELTLIDQHTTRRGLDQELRANELYLSLAVRR